MTAAGIALATSVFTVVRSVLLRPLPYPDPDRIVRLVLDHPAYPASVTALNLLDLGDLRAAPAFTAVSAWTGAAPRTLTGDGEPTRLTVALVMEDFDRVLGVRPAAGRFFVDDDFAEGAEPAVVVSHRVWTEQLGGRPEVVGSTVLLDHRPTRVVGVLPPLPLAVPEADLWAPLSARQPWQLQRSSLWLEGIARVRTDISVAGAQAATDAVTARLAAAFPATNRDRGARLLPLRDEIVGPTRAMLTLLASATGLMVLVACVNVVLLLSARARDRRAELALRASLGGGARIRRQIFGELALMTLAGGVLGLLATRPLLYGLLALHPDLPRSAEVRVDAVALSVSAFALLLVTWVGGLAPAREARRSDPATALRRARTVGSPGERATGSALVGAQIALAVTLLAGAGLMMRTLIDLGRVDLGFDAGSIVSFELAPPAARYPRAENVRELHEALFTALRAVPGVRAVGSVNNIPFGGPEWSMAASFETLAEIPEERRPRAGILIVHPSWFEVLGMSPLAGRLPGAADDASAPGVAVVSAGLAAAVFGAPEAAVGERIRFLDRALEVVGVVEDVRRTGLRTGEEHELYVSSLQHFERASHVVVRTGPDPMGLAPSLRAAVREIDPALPVEAITTLERRVAGSLAPERLRAVLLGGFALVALVLAALGVYGIVAYDVARRGREMAVRLSVGAAPRGIVGSVVGGTLRTAALGAAVGGAAAWVAGGWIEGLLYGVRGRDPATLLTAIGVLVLAAALASLQPALRAARTDPASVLRDEG